MRKKLTFFSSKTTRFIIDDSLFTFRDRTQSLQKEKNKKTKKNIEIVGSLENEGLRWDANTEAVGFLEKRYNVLINEEKDLSILGKYLAHTSVLDLSFILYQIKILSKYNVKNSSQERKLHKYQVKPGIFNLIKSIIYSILFFLNLNIVLVLKTFSKFRLVIREKKRVKASIGVDLAYCNIIDQNFQVLTGARSDAFLLHPESNIDLNDLVFINEGWPCKKDIIKNIANSDVPIKIAGSLYDNRLSILVFLKIFYRINCKYLYESIKLARKKIPLSVWEHYSRSFFHGRKIVPYVLLSNINIKAYLSRMDYSEIHHCYASACYDLGVSFHGISHSSSGGLGHVPQMSFVSFDYYYVNSKSFVDKYYKTWINKHIKLIPVGPWRSDFIEDYSEKSVKELRSKFITNNVKYLIGVHLPVPDSYLFNDQSIAKWMQCFYEILNKHQDCYFILFSRSELKGKNSEKDEPNLKFENYINLIESTGRGSLSSNYTDSSDGSYIWTNTLDLMIGCTFSDSVLESWVSGIPACSYSDIGKGRAYLDSVDENLRLYDSESINRLLDLLKSKNWPSKKTEKDLKSLFGFQYYGNAIPIILENINSSNNEN
ncbi:hypothetical protein N8823_04320 [Candidatus Pseudothioglobus singularis]|nr:hypothetical protein [Candidatus Pseudothioglobus singularis]